MGLILCHPPIGLDFKFLMLAMKRVTTNVFSVMSTNRSLTTDVSFLSHKLKELRFAGSKTLWKLDSTYLVHIHNHSMIRTITKNRAQKSYTFLAYRQRLTQTDLKLFSSHHNYFLFSPTTFSVQILDAASLMHLPHPTTFSTPQLR